MTTNLQCCISPQGGSREERGGAGYWSFLIQHHTSIIQASARSFNPVLMKGWSPKNQTTHTHTHTVHEVYSLTHTHTQSLKTIEGGYFFTSAYLPPSSLPPVEELESGPCQTFIPSSIQCCHVIPGLGLGLQYTCLFYMIIVLVLSCSLYAVNQCSVSPVIRLCKPEQPPKYGSVRRDEGEREGTNLN